MNSAAGEKMDEITEWTSVADLKNLCWYFSTFEDQSIHMVDLKRAVDAARPRSQLSRWKEQAADRRCLVRHHDAQGCLTISEKGTWGAER